MSETMKMSLNVPCLIMQKDKNGVAKVSKTHRKHYFGIFLGLSYINFSNYSLVKH